ncbi:MAG: beta strand repeat-containing protein [Promethearchaeota archaeon]
MDISGNGTYIEGETFTVRVNYQNTGGTAVLNVDATLDYNGFTYLSANDPSPVSVAAGGTNYQEFQVTVLSGTFNSPVTIDASAAGTEQYSGRAISTISGNNDLSITIQFQSNLSIINVVDYTGRGVYVGGETFTVRVYYNNTGGTSALSVDSILNFNGNSNLTSSNPSPITVAAGSSNYQSFLITVASGATSTLVEIDASVTAVEQYSGRALSDSTSNTNDLEISIQSQASLNVMNITDVTGRGYYVGGETFTVRVYYNNTGGTNATNVDGVLDFNGYTYLSQDNPDSITVPSGGIAYQEFTITVSQSATTAAVIIDVTASGNEQYSNRSLSATSGTNDLSINIYEAADVYVDNVVDYTGASIYDQGESFEVRVTIKNDGGVAGLNGTVDLMFSTQGDLNYTNLTATTGLTVPAGGSIVIRFNVTVELNATPAATVTIDANFTCTEQYTNDTITDLSASPNTASISILAEAVLRITSVLDLTDQTAYVQGQSLEVQVTLDNTGGDADVSTGNLTLIFNATGYTTSPTIYTGISIAAGTFITRTFNVSISLSASTGIIQIDAHFLGVDNQSNNIDKHAESPEEISVQSQANLQILNITDYTGRGIYVGGETFTVRVYYQNTGGTAAQSVDGILNFNGYSDLSSTNPAPVTVPASSINYQEYIITVATNASNNVVQVDATATGTEAYTSRALSAATTYLNNLNITIQAPAEFSILNITDYTGRGVYIGGETFTVRVYYNNSGGTTALNVDASLNFNGYSYLTASDPLPINISAGTIAYQEFSINASVDAITSPVQIDATASGVEQYTNRALSASTTTSNNLDLDIQARANLTITGIQDITARGVYIEGENFTIRVNYQNLGGSDALNVDSALDFNGYAFLSANDPAPVNVSAGNTGYQDFQVTVLSGALNDNVTIDASATANEEYTSRNLTALSGTNDLTLEIQSASNLIITSMQDITGRGTYVEGESFIVRVNYQNTGGTRALSVDSILDFNGYGYLSSNNPISISIPAGGTGYQDFTITVNAGANNSVVVIDANATAVEEYSNRPISTLSGSNDLSVNIQSKAALTIVNITDLSGNGNYVGGESFNIRVYYNNTGGTDALNVDATIIFNGYTYMSSSDPAPITVSAGTISYQDFTITLSINATSSMVEIDASATGSENLTSRALAATSGTNDLDIQVNATAKVNLILVDDNGLVNVSRDTQGLTITAQVSNTGGTNVNITGIALTFSGFLGISQAPEGWSTPLLLSTGETKTFNFSVNVSSTASVGVLTVDLSINYTEFISNRNYSKSGATTTASFRIQSMALISVYSVTSQVSSVFAGASFFVDVIITNQGTGNNYAALSLNSIILEFEVANVFVQASTSASGTIWPGQNKTLAYQVNVNSSASAGTYWINASVTGSDINNGKPVQDDGASINGSITVKIPTELVISNVVYDPAATNVTQGYSSFNITVTVENSLGNPNATIHSAWLSINSSTHSNLTWDYTISLLDSLPVSISAGSSINLNFSVSVLSNATPDVTTKISVYLKANDSIGTDMSNTDPSTTPAWIVRTPAELSIVAVHVEPVNVITIGQSAIQLIVEIQNVNGSWAIVNSLQLTGTSGAGVITGPSPSIPEYIPGYQAKNFTFLLDTSSGAAGEYTIDAQVTYSDVNITTSGSDNSATTPGWMYLRTAANVVVDRVVISENILVQGMSSISVEVYLDNLGNTSATVGNIEVLFNGSVGTSSGYIITDPGSWPTVPALANDVKVTLSLDTNDNAAPGLVQAGAKVTATDDVLLTSKTSNFGTNDTFTMQTPASLSIVSIADISTNGTYIEGETFIVRVIFQNSGGTDALNVNATLDYNGYVFLSSNNPSPVTVPAGSTAYQEYSVTVLNGAINALVTIDADATGTEQYSNVSLAVSSGTNDLDVNIQGKANIIITSIIDVTGRGTYVGGETFTVRVNYQNNGTTDALSVDSTLDYNGYTYLSSTNPAPVTILAGSTGYQLFNVTASSVATTSTVIIDANVEGTEEYSGRSLSASSGSNDLTLSIRKQASLSITSIDDVTGRGLYIEGETFTVRVNYQNTGDVDALSVDGTLDYNGYLDLSSTNPIPITVPAGGTGYQLFNVTVLTGAENNIVTIDADATGVEQYSSRSLSASSGANDLDLSIQSQAELTITSIEDITGRGIYVEGENFTIRVHYQNSGGTNAINVDSDISFNGYSYLSASDATPITVPAGGSAYQEFTITVLDGAQNTEVEIDAIANGTEQYSTRSLSASSGSNDLNVDIQGAANMSLSIADITQAQPYSYGESFIVRVTVENTGLTAIVNMSVWLTFGGATGYNATPVSYDNETLSPSQTQQYDFNISIADGASFGVITITGHASGNENITGDSIIQTKNLPVSVEAPTIFSISSVTNLNTPSGPYARGSLFSVRVTLWNGGDNEIANGTVMLFFNMSGYTSIPASQFVTNISAHSSKTVDFNVSVGTSADIGWLEVNANFSGKTSLNSDVVVNNATTPLVERVLGPSNVSIDAILDHTGLGTYVREMNFDVDVVLNNSGELNVSVTSLVLDFNGASGYVNSSVSAFILHGGETRHVIVTVSIGSTATLGTINIGANVSYIEDITDDVYAITSGQNNLSITTQSQASITILNITNVNGNSTYVGGETFTIRVYYQNTGGTDALNVDSTLDFNGYNNLTESNPAPINVSAGATRFQVFTISVVVDAINSPVEIDALMTATEKYSNRSISDATTASNDLNVNIQGASDLSIVNIQDITGRGIYVEGETFIIRVNYQNDGSTDVLNVDATLSFNGYAYLSATNPDPINVSATSSAYQDFNVTVNAGAVNSLITIDAMMTGLEEYSGRNITDSTTNTNNLGLNIQSQANLIIIEIQDISGNGTYIEGETFAIRVYYNNTGGTDALNVDAVLNFNGYAFLSSNNPSSITVSAGGIAYQEFQISVLAGATNANVTIDADATGSEQYTIRPISATSGTNDLELSIQASSSLQIINITDVTGRGTYIEGETFTIRVYFQNSGGTDISGLDSTLDYNGYADLTASNPAPITLAAGSTSYQEFQVTVGSDPVEALVTIDASASGLEKYSNKSVSATSGTNDLDLMIQQKAILSITSIEDLTGRGTYIEGETFTIRVNYQNTGGTDALTVNSTILFNGYSYLSANTSTPVTVEAGDSAHQDFLITILADPLNSLVTIDANANGEENHSGRALSAVSGTNDLGVYIKSMANLTISSIDDITGRGIYIEGETFTVRVNYQNTGGTDALNVDSTLNYNGYSFLSASNPAAVTVPAGGSAYQDFQVTVQAGAINSGVEIDANAIGSEKFSSRALSAESGANDLDISIQAKANLQILNITDYTGRGTYVEGESFVIRVYYQNTGGTNATSVDSTLDFNGYTYLSSSNPSPILAPAGQITYQSFIITVLSGAINSNVTIDASATGIEEYSSRVLSTTSGSNDLNVKIQSSSHLIIASIQDVTGRGVYVEGETFTIRINYQNTGGTDALNVDSALDFNGYTYLVETNPAPITVVAGSSNYQEFNLTVLSNPTNAIVTIDASATGIEEYSLNSINALSGSNDLQVNIQSHQSLSITLIEDITALDTYVQGMSFTVNVTLDNTAGGTSVINGILKLTFNTSGYTSPQQTGITISAGTVVIKQFTVTIEDNANPGSIGIGATFSGDEQYTNIPVVESLSNGSEVVNVQAGEALVISLITWSPNLSTFVQGMFFIVNVTLDNTAGGTDVVNGEVNVVTAYNGYVSSPLSNIVIPAGSTVEVSIQVNISANADTGTIQIDANFTGIENISNDNVLLSTPNDPFTISVQASAELVISSVTDLTDTAPYALGESFNIRVTVRNDGGTAVVGATIWLTFGVATGFSTSPVSYNNQTIGASQQVDFVFTIMISPNASDGLITITAHASGNENISSDAMEDSDSSLQVYVEPPSEFRISSVTNLNDPPEPYARTSTFKVRVLLSLSGSETVNGTLMLKFNLTGYISTPLSYNVVNFNGSKPYDFNVTVSGSAQTGFLLVDANFTGTYSNSTPVQVDNAVTPLTVQVLAPSNLEIYAITDDTGLGSYVQGMSFDVKVWFNNSGGCSVTIDSLVLSFNGAENYSHSNVASFEVAGGEVKGITVQVTIDNTATTGSITIDANASGHEQVTNGSINVLSGSNDLTVEVTSSATLSIISIVDITGNGTYVEGESFTIRVNYQNTGGTDVLNADATLSYNGYAYLSSNDPSPVVVPASGTAYQDFIVTVLAGAEDQDIVIDADVVGTENKSARSLANSSGSNDLSARIQSASSIGIKSLQDKTGSAAYVQGMNVSVRVYLENLGGTAAINVNVSLTFNGTGYSSTWVLVNISANTADMYVDLTAIISSSATSGDIAINAIAIGRENRTGDVISDLDGANTPLAITVQDSANVSISSVIDITGASAYVQGMSLLVNITIDNTLGGTRVTSGVASLTFNASGYSALNQTGLIVNAGSSLIVQFNVSISSSAINGSILIDARFTGVEEYSNNLITVLNATSPLEIIVQEKAIVIISRIVDTSGVSAHNTGSSFILNVTLSNIGGTSAMSGTLQLSFGTATGIQASPQNMTGIQVLPYSSPVYQFNISISENATTGNITITCNYNGVENITSRVLSDSNSTWIVIQEKADLVINNVELYVGSEPFKQGESFWVRVHVQNLGTIPVIHGNLTLMYNCSGYSTTTLHQDLFIDGLTSEYYNFKIDIDQFADIGNLNIDAEFHGLEQGTLNPMDQVGADTSLTVVVEPRPANIELVSGSVVFNNTEGSTVYQGQENLLLTFNVTNTGGSAAVNIFDALDFSINDLDYIVEDYNSNNPSTVNPGENKEFSFLLNIKDTAATGILTYVHADFIGDDEYYGNATSLYSFLIQWTVKKPQVIEITNITIDQDSLVQGMSNISLIVNLYNPSIYDANVTAMDLQFMNGSVDHAGDFAFSSNTTIPFVIGSKTRAWVRYNVSVNPDATIETILTIVARIAASHDHDGYLFNMSNDVANETDTCIVHEPENIHVANVIASEIHLVQGQENVIITLNLSNPGIYDANVTTILIAMLNNTVDYTSNFSISTNQTMPFVIPAHSFLLVNYSLSVKINATSGKWYLINVTVNAMYNLSGYIFDLSPTYMDQLTRVSVQTTGKLSITSVVVGSHELTQGQGNVSLQVVVNNPSIFDANVTSVQINLFAGLVNYSSNFTLFTLTSFPMILPANTSITINYTLSVKQDAETNLTFVISASASAYHNLSGTLIDLSSSMSDTDTVIVYTPADLQLIEISTLVMNVTQGQENLSVVVRVENVNETFAVLTSLSLSFSIGSQYFTCTPNITISGAIINGNSVLSVEFIVSIARDTPAGFVNIDATVIAVGGRINNDASDLDGSLVIDQWYIQEKGDLSIQIVPQNSEVNLGNSTGLNIRIENVGGTQITLTRILLTYEIGTVDVTLYVIPGELQVSETLNKTLAPGEWVIIRYSFTLADSVMNAIKDVKSDALLVRIAIEAREGNTQFDISSQQNTSISLNVGGGTAGTFDLVKFLTDYMWYIIPAIAGIVILTSVVGVRRAQIKKASKTKMQQKAKAYFAKQAVGKPAPITGKSVPFAGKDIPMFGKGGKIMKEAGAEAEEKRHLTPEELAEIEKTEQEVTEYKEKKICIVHKGPISGAMYMCPKCEALYCMKCATALKRGGEKCWQCGAPIDVPDMMPVETKPAPAAPQKPTRKKSFMMQNMSRVNNAMKAIGMPHELKLKYLKEMTALSDPDQVRFLMELEKMAYPDKITADEVAPVESLVEDKLSALESLNAEPSTITDADVAKFLGKEFTILDPLMIETINTLPWPKEKKLALARELTALSPEEMVKLLKDILEPQEDDEE